MSSPRTLTLEHAAAMLGVRRKDTVRRLLALHVPENRMRIVAGYDRAGRVLLRADFVDALVVGRTVRSAWRGRHVGDSTYPGRRTADGQWLCACHDCTTVVGNRGKRCCRHRTKVP